MEHEWLQGVYRIQLLILLVIYLLSPEGANGMRRPVNITDGGGGGGGG